ncbi:hypothetical protein DFP73DRAFT_523239 [Morchella snyderi]|nr:hypothetical protein DFP73DRAFT_523239 [Morchella snyderi]
MPVLTRLQAARIAHEGNILFMAALNAVNPPLTVTPAPSPDSRPLTSTPVPSANSSPPNPHPDPHPAAPTRANSAQTSQQLRNELWRLSMEHSTYIVEEVFKPQLIELLSMGGGFDPRSGPGIVIGALDYVRSVWPSDSKQILMMGAAVHCVESILQIRWVKNVVVQCSACTERGPETIQAVLEHIGRNHSKDGHDNWEWYTRKWPPRLPIKEVGACE